MKSALRLTLVCDLCGSKPTADEMRELDRAATFIGRAFTAYTFVSWRCASCTDIERGRSK